MRRGSGAFDYRDGMSSTGGRATARPAVIPDDVDDPAIVKASGRVTLPLHVRWSGPKLSYDLDDRRDRLRVYEQVLREGTADDVRRVIDVDVLIDLWDDLYLPSHVRTAWRSWLRDRRGVSV